MISEKGFQDIYGHWGSGKLHGVGAINCGPVVSGRR